METTAVNPLIWIAGILALVAIAAIFVFRDRLKLGLKIKNAEVNVDGSKAAGPDAPTAAMKGLKSRSGALNYRDDTGHGMSMEDVEVDKDIDINRTKGESGSSSKK